MACYLGLMGSKWRQLDGIRCSPIKLAGPIAAGQPSYERLVLLSSNRAERGKFVPWEWKASGGAGTVSELAPRAVSAPVVERRGDGLHA